MNVSGEPLLAPGTGLKSLWDTSRFSTRRTQLDSGDVQLYGFARQALIAGMRTLAPGSVLAPAFICDTAVEPLVATGTSIRFYPVRDDLSPDWEWLDANRAPGDSALMLVHYYGFPNGRRVIQLSGIGGAESSAEPGQQRYLGASPNLEMDGV